MLGTEGLRWWRAAERPALGLLAVPAAVALPAAYYFALSVFDPAWELASESNAAGSQATWTWPWWAIALSVAPLAVPAALAYRTPALDWQSVAVRVWPFAALLVYLQPTGTFPYHSFQGLAIPLSILAVQGVLSVWPRPRPLLVAAALALLIVPGTVHKAEVAVNSVRAAGDPYFVFADEQRALDALEADPRPGGVLAPAYGGPHAAVQDRARGLRGCALVDARLGGASAGDPCAVRDWPSTRQGPGARTEERCALPLRGLQARTARSTCPASSPARGGTPLRLRDRVRAAPARRHRRRAEVRLALLFAGAALLSGITLLDGIQPNDEGLMLAAASRIAEGQVPYSDFWWFYPPGQPYLLAGLWELFGPSLLVWRLVRVLCDATVALLAYLLALRGGASPGLALASWLAAALAMAYPSGPHPFPFTLVLALTALLLFERRPLAAGALVGVATAWRIEFAAYLGLGIVLAYAVRGDGFVRHAGSFVGVAAAAGLLLYAPVVAAAGIGDSWDLLVRYPVEDFGEYQSLPFPLDYDGPLNTDSLGGFLSDSAENLLLFYLPLVLVLGLAGSLLALGLRFRRERWPQVAGAVFAIGMAHYLVTRPDVFHTAPLAVMVSVLAAWAIAESREPDPAAGARSPLRIAGACSWGAVGGRARVRHPRGSGPALARAAYRLCRAAPSGRRRRSGSRSRPNTTRERRSART